MTEIANDAWEELHELLDDGDEIIAIKFGEGGPDGLIPNHMKSVLLQPNHAEPYMRHWSFEEGYGTEDCPPLYAWSYKKVFVVCLYDGSTWLSSVPKTDDDTTPHYYGGG